MSNRVYFRSLMVLLTAVATVQPSYAADLVVSLAGGGNATSNRTYNWTFPAIRPVVSGGSGVYSYTWSVEPQSPIYVWINCGPSETCNPRVRATHNCDDTDALYRVTVFDAITGQSASSNYTYYQFRLRVIGESCP